MSTQRINALPDGTATFTTTARIAFEDANDASNTTKFLTVNSLSGEFLPLAGGTMSGDIDMDTNSILLRNHSVSSSSDALIFNSALDFTFNTGSIPPFIEFKTTVSLVGELVHFDFIGLSSLSNSRFYGGLVADIIVNTDTLEEGGWFFTVISGGTSDTPVLGMNLDSDLAVKIFDNLRFLNADTGGDPILLSNDPNNEVLTLKGDFTILQSELSASVILNSGRTTPATNNVIADITYRNDDGVNDVVYSRIIGRINSPTVNEEAGDYRYQVRHFDGATSTLLTFITINMNNTGLTGFNRGISLLGNLIEEISFTDFDVITDPGVPAANTGRSFLEDIDANNVGRFEYLKKNGVITKVQIA